MRGSCRYPLCWWWNKSCVRPRVRSTCNLLMRINLWNKRRKSERWSWDLSLRFCHRTWSNWLLRLQHRKWYFQYNTLAMYMYYVVRNIKLTCLTKRKCSIILLTRAKYNSIYFVAFLYKLPTVRFTLMRSSSSLIQIELQSSGSLIQKQLIIINKTPWWSRRPILYESFNTICTKY